jgi:hypothetical protein
VGCENKGQLLRPVTLHTNHNGGINYGHFTTQHLENKMAPYKNRHYIGTNRGHVKEDDLKQSGRERYMMK